MLVVNNGLAGSSRQPLISRYPKGLRQEKSHQTSSDTSTREKGREAIRDPTGVAQVLNT